MADSDWESLLDFQYVPGGIISGLTGDQVEIIAQQSIEDGDILRDLEPEIINELNLAEQSLRNEKTVYQTENNVKRLKAFLGEKGLST